jgi:hypothetical protein
MTIKKQHLLVALFLGFGLTGAVSAAQTPNHYECSGRNTNLTLTISSDNRAVGIAPIETTLDLQVNTMSFSYGATEITTESTLIGELWEVPLEQIPDLYVKYASIIIPTIALEQGQTRFNTKLVITKVNTPFSPDTFQGVVNPSRYINLRCTASMLYF